jgi:hypothetical protein
MNHRRDACGCEEKRWRIKIKGFCLNGD